MKSRIGPIVLVVAGVVFLLGNLGVIPHVGRLLAVWWPAILIAVGVWKLAS